MKKIIENGGLKLHLLKTEKYKTNTIVFKMKTPLTKEERYNSRTITTCIAKWYKYIS